ncbi:MAG: DUF167 domain-containing protein [Candidatus Aegiribacteria sp.]|nr:DUF167 domain-containing protein [Candidatus Aegiribacteria sp.]
MSSKQRKIHLEIKVIPRASITEIRGRMADGTLKIALNAPPADGKANRELQKFLAGEFGTALSSIRLLSGTASRRKLVSIGAYSKLPDWLRE